MEFLFQYGLFVAKALTALVALGVIIALAIGLGRRGGKGEGLAVTSLSRRYEDMTAILERSILPKKAFKARAKAHKAAAKEREKAAGRAYGMGESSRPRVFVIDFHGDIRASATASLREEVTALLTLATERDEVVVRVENAGGMVHGHGLAASQLARVRQRGIPLTVAVDKVAASGGYMMACVANRIIAAPFALVGSIGVLAQIPNFNRLLERHGIEFELVKAGENKRSLTMFGKNTEADREKMQGDIEAVHALFRSFVARYRPELDLDAVANGDHWYGADALERKLVDALETSDDYLLAASDRADVFSIEYRHRSGLGERLASVVGASAERLLDALQSRAAAPLGRARR